VGFIPRGFPRGLKEIYYRIHRPLAAGSFHNSPIYPALKKSFRRMLIRKVLFNDREHPVFLQVQSMPKFYWMSK
jgi:hypothetical protein